MTQKVLWSGRFKEGTADTTLTFTSSLALDQRLARYDVLGSLAHARMLARQDIISFEDGQRIVQGLKELLALIEAGTLPINPQLEDIHSNIEFLLTDKVQDAGARLHTARSRNDQVVTDVRMYLRDVTLDMIEEIMTLETVLLDRASENLEVVLPGFTHMQHAQPVTLGHHLLAHFFKFQRDAERLMDSYKRLNVCPLGSAALAGTTYNIDRLYTSQMLGFDSPTANSIDGVSDRDFAAEFIFDAALCSVHLSALCEELVYWSSPEFGFVEISDAYSTGSSIMPQKKNPDVAELTRGRAGLSIGHLVSILTVMKGLPLSYNRDLQEDKTALFAAADSLLPCLRMSALMMSTITFKKERMLATTKDGFLNATDLADYLVTKGMPFRAAHEVVGRIVRYAIEQGRRLEDLTLEELGEFSDLIKEDIYTVLPVERCVSRRRSVGGTSPDVAPLQLSQAMSAVSKQARFVEEGRSRLEKCWSALLA